MLAERTDSILGTMLGKDYRVLQILGTGGMAVVYLVEHQTLLKRFAAKVLSRNLASSLEARARFTQEAHAASQLDHENIVSITDLGVTADHRPFFIMELLRGQTLDARLAEGPMTIEEIVAVAVPVARALAHAHAEGIVHLDVKPENIFLVQRSQGRWGVKVVDFGIARTPQNPRFAKDGETVGSPMFMAPEMCAGADEVDQRADVYSFGILLYLMLCGRLPFSDDSLARVLQMQLVELPPPPREVNAQLSPEIALVIERALAKHPDDRYPSMAALLRDLDAALPLGADRMLVEAQTGTAMDDTPFAGAMTVGRNDSHRMRRASPVPPGGALASHPPAPRRRRLAAIVLPSVLVVIALAGVTAYRQLADPGARRADAATGPAEPRVATPAVVAMAPRPAPIPKAEAAAEPGPAQVDPPAAAATETAPSDDTAPSDEPAALPAPGPAAETPSASRTTATTPPARPKSTRRAGKRTVALASPPIAAAPVVAAAEPAPAVEAAVAHRAEPVEAPAAPVVPPAPAAPVAVVAAPPPAPIAMAPVAPAGPGSLDAVPSITALDVKGPLSPSIVRRSVDRTLSSLRSCYRTAARDGGATPVIDLQLSFEIDENGLATQVATSGARFGSLPGCVAGVAGQIRTQEAPDVGTAHVTVGIRFRPS